MRNRAVVVSWHKYHPHFGYGHRVMFEYWLKNAPTWATEVDKLYLIDSDMKFSYEDKQRLKSIFKDVEVIDREHEGHHWVQFKWIIPKIQEQNMLFLDNDVFVSKPGIVDKWFKHIEHGADFVGSFDGSGGMQDLIGEKYPQMKELGNRMGSYYFILTKNLLNKVGEYTFEPNYFNPGTYIPELDYITKENDWLDSFGWFTLKMLDKGAHMMAIPDPRHTIYLQPEEGTWVINKEPMHPENLGYYHIRNGNFANYIMTSKAAGNEEDYQREISGNKREILRSLAWFYIMDSELKHWKHVQMLLKDLGVDEKMWNLYIEEFVKYHEL